MSTARALACAFFGSHSAGGGPFGSGPRNAGASSDRLGFAPDLAAAQLVGVRLFLALEQADDFVVARVDRERGVRQHASGHEPAAGFEQGAPREPRAPGVVVHPTLVAQAIDETRLLEQLVELGTVRLGHLGAERVPARREVPFAICCVGRAEDGADQHLGHLERVLLADVVAGNEAVADLVKIRLQRLGDAVCLLQIIQDLLRRAPADALLGDAARSERGPQAFERARPRPRARSVQRL